MKYTIVNLKKEFPTEDKCLDFIFKSKFPKEYRGYYKVTGRKCYANSSGHQIHPLSGTIFEKSETKLTIWFHAIFLFSTSKNGVSAKEIQRQVGVTYKTAWRMGHQIRKLMEQGTEPLSGTLEADETFYGKSGTSKEVYKNKNTILGVVERNGKVRVKKVPSRGVAHVLPFIGENVAKGSMIVTDEYSAYDRLSQPAYGFMHMSVKHGKRHYTFKGQHTNTIEGFWGQFKRSVKGTYAFVSKQHLQAYLDEFAWRYNRRSSSVPTFLLLLAKASQ